MIFSPISIVVFCFSVITAAADCHSVLDQKRKRFYTLECSKKSDSTCNYIFGGKLA